MTSNGTVGITGSQNVDIASTGANATLSAGQNIDITANQDATVTASSGIATLSGNTYANVKGNQNAEIVGGHNTNVGLGGGNSSNKTIVVGSSKVEVKSGEVEIN